MCGRRLRVFLAGLFLLVPTSALALTIHQKLTLDLVRAFPQCGSGTCQSLPLNAPGTSDCATVPGVPQPFSFDSGSVILRVDGSNTLRSKVILSGVINGDSNTVNSSVEDWSVVARVRQTGDKQWFALAGGPLIRENVINSDVDVELMTFAVVNGGVSTEKVATLDFPVLFSTQEIRVLSVSVLDPAGCVIAKGGPVID